MSIWKNLFCFSSIAAALLAGCGKIVAPPDTDSFGLTKIEFAITSENLGRLNSMTFARREVPARVEIAGESRKILVRYSGQRSLGQLKSSYTVEFRDGKLFRGHREYVISAQNGDVTKLHPGLGFWAFRQAGLMASDAEPAAVYLNREYQGLYYLIEPIDADFFKRRNRRLGSLYEAFNGQYDGAHFSFAGGYDVRLGFDSEGEREDFYGDLEWLIQTLDASTPENLPSRLEPLLDVENYLRYLAVSVLLHNWDGYFNNFRLHLDPQIGKFQIIPWDLDNLLEFYEGRSRLEGANELSAKLLQVPAYRRRYKQILLELMDEKLTVARLEARIDEIAAQITRAFAADRFLTARGNKTLVEHVAETKQFIRDWYAQIRGELGRLEGNAHVSLVAFEFADTKINGVKIPLHVDFPEINFRYYVRCQEKRGVIFPREFVPRHGVALMAKKLCNEPYQALAMTCETDCSAGNLQILHLNPVF